MKLIKKPSTVHTAYNPTLFVFEGNPNTTEQISLEALTTGNSIKIDIDFDSVGKASIDVSSFIKSMFERKIVDTYDDCIVDAFQVVRYCLIDSSKNNMGEFTAVRSVAQIGESHDLAPLVDKVLSGFDKLIVYNDSNYNRDGSVLEEINDTIVVSRRAVTCDMDYFPKPKCTGNWVDFICQLDDGGTYTGYALAKTLNIDNTNYSLLDGFSLYPTIDEFTLSILSQNDYLNRANGLIEYMEGQLPCLLTINNNPLKQDIECNNNVVYTINMLDENGLDVTNQTLNIDCEPHNGELNVITQDGNVWNAIFTGSFENIEPSANNGNSFQTIFYSIGENDTGIERKFKVVINDSFVEFNQAKCNTPPPIEPKNLIIKLRNTEGLSSSMWLVNGNSYYVTYEKVITLPLVLGQQHNISLQEVSVNEIGSNTKNASFTYNTYYISYLTQSTTYLHFVVVSHDNLGNAEVICEAGT